MASIKHTADVRANRLARHRTNSIRSVSSRCVVLNFRIKNASKLTGAGMGTTGRSLQVIATTGSNRSIMSPVSPPRSTQPTNPRSPTICEEQEKAKEDDVAKEQAKMEVEEAASTQVGAVRDTEGGNSTEKKKKKKRKKKQGEKAKND